MYCVLRTCVVLHVCVVCSVSAPHDHTTPPTHVHAGDIPSSSPTLLTTSHSARPLDLWSPLEDDLECPSQTPPSLSPPASGLVTNVCSDGKLPVVGIVYAFPVLEWTCWVHCSCDVYFILCRYIPHWMSIPVTVLHGVCVLVFAATPYLETLYLCCVLKLLQPLKCGFI